MIARVALVCALSAVVSCDDGTSVAPIASMTAVSCQLSARFFPTGDTPSQTFDQVALTVDLANCPMDPLGKGQWQVEYDVTDAARVDATSYTYATCGGHRWELTSLLAVAPHGTLIVIVRDDVGLSTDVTCAESPFTW